MRTPPVLVLILLTACAGASRPAGSSSTPAPAAPVLRTAHYAPGTSRYRIISHAHQEQQIEGNRQESNFLLEYLLTATLAPQAGGNDLQVTIVFDSMRAEGGLITAGEIARVKDLHLTGTLSPDGQINNLSGDSALVGQLQRIASGIRQFFPRIPAGGAEPGQEWSDTADVNTGGTPQLDLHSVNHRKAVGWVDQAGKRALQIDVTTQYTLTGSGQQMGQDYTLNGTGERVTTQYLGVDGHYLGSASRDSSNVTVSLAALGMSFPSIQLRADTVTVIP